MPTPRKEFKLVLDIRQVIARIGQPHVNAIIGQPQSITVNGDVFRNGEFVTVTEKDGELRHMFIIEIGLTNARGATPI